MLINLVIDNDKNEISVMPESFKSPTKTAAAERLALGSKYINSNPTKTYSSINQSSRNSAVIQRIESGAGIIEANHNNMPLSKY